MDETSELILWGQGSENILPIPKIIWLYWDPVKESSLVDICLQQIELLHAEFTVNIVNQNSLASFLQDIPDRNPELPFANYSDIIRLALLSKYGGIWMDSSILAIQNLNWIYTLKNKYNSDLIGFYANFITKDTSFPILETWLLASPAKNPFIEKWYKEFSSCYTSEHPASYYKDMPKQWLQGMDAHLAQYLICYVSAIQVMRTDHSFRILMLPANDSAHFYNFNLKLKPHQLAEEFLLKENASCDLPLVKFERRGREAIDDYINKGLMSKKSLLYRLAPQQSKKYTSLYHKLKYVRYVAGNIFKIVISGK